MENIGIIPIMGIFLASAIAIWVAGIELAKTTDTLDTRYKLGDAIGGLIVLAIVTTLPEIAIVISASLAGHYDIVLGNLIGGISIKALAIVLLDLSVKGKKPLSYLAGSRIISYEAIFVLIIVGASFLGMNESIRSISYSPVSILLAIMWLAGIYIISHLRKKRHLYAGEKGAIPGRMHHERRAVHNHIFYAKKSNSYVVTVFLVSALITLIAGVLIEKTANPIASYFGLSGGLFAATVLSLVAALPEISTGIESIIINDNQLAVSDMLGGSAMLPAIFVTAELFYGGHILALASSKDKVLLIIGLLMTAVYTISLITKPKRRYLRLGIDSILVVIIYALGLVLLSQIG